MGIDDILKVEYYDRLRKLGYKSPNSFSSLKRQIPSQSTNGSSCIHRHPLSFRRRSSVNHLSPSSPSPIEIVEEVEIMATFELYRRSTIGMCLTETLDEMVQSGTLSPELAIQVLVQFDKDAMFKNDDRQENVSRVKIVACDSKLLTQ
ncbi:hypothetical protein Bca4012_087966 [Brassica carinata]